MDDTYQAAGETPPGRQAAPSPCACAAQQFFKTAGACNPLLHDGSMNMMIMKSVQLVLM